MRENAKLWRECLACFRPHAGVLAAITLAGLVQSFSYAPLAAIFRWIFDDILVPHPRASLGLALAALFAVQLGGLGLAYWIRVTGLRLNHDVVARLRERALGHLYHLPRSFHTAADTERLHVVLVYETNWIEAMSNALTVQLLPSTLSAAVLFAILFWIRPAYACIIAVTAPAMFVANRLMVRECWFKQEGLRRAFENFSRGVRFAIAAMELTRAQAAEEMEMRRQAANVSELRAAALDLHRFDAIQELVQGAVLVAATLLVLIAGGYGLAEGVMTRGQMMAFYVAAALFAAQARSIVGAIPEIRMGIRAFRELAALLAHPEREPYRGAREVARLGEIRVEGVRFGYTAGKNLLNDVTLAIAPGEKIALLGANGSGKSTLIHLIGGYYRPEAGRLTAAGVPYDELDIRGLRGRMAVVPQNPFLFAGTIRENVTYGAENATEQEIEGALASAGAADFVAQCAEGLATTIGDHGIRLSGGQRQKLVIARALLRKPQLLILDEPTNHLDQEAIEQLMDHLRRLDFSPAVLVISHERRVLECADRAYRLAEGRLCAIEAGVGAH